MRNQFYWVLIVLHGAATAQMHATVIYGQDTRKDLFEVDETTATLADSTVALIHANNVRSLGINYSMVTKDYGPSENLCKSEPFYSQKTAAFCSGFLVNEDTIITAGHCVSSASECSSTKFVFGFAMQGSSQNSWVVRSSDLYGCHRVIRTVMEPNGDDFAVIKLNRAVKNHKPLPIFDSASLQVGQRLMVLGHPSGLPLKIAGGAVIRSINSKYLVTNTNTYGGNSGSAVLDEATGKVVGVIVRGETDFVLKDKCYVSKVCAFDGCRGEDATLMSRIQPYF